MSMLIFRLFHRWLSSWSRWSSNWFLFKRDCRGGSAKGLLSSSVGPAAVHSPVHRVRHLHRLDDLIEERFFHSRKVPLEALVHIRVLRAELLHGSLRRFRGDGWSRMAMQFGSIGSRIWQRLLDTIGHVRGYCRRPGGSRSSFSELGSALELAGVELGLFTGQRGDTYRERG